MPDAPCSVLPQDDPRGAPALPAAHPPALAVRPAPDGSDQAWQVLAARTLRGGFDPGAPQDVPDQALPDGSGRAPQVFPGRTLQDGPDRAPRVFPDPAPLDGPAGSAPDLPAVRLLGP